MAGMSDENTPPASPADAAAGPDATLQKLVMGKVVVPLTEPPQMKDDMIEHWNPAVLTRHEDGSLWIAAFTTPERCAAFCEQQPGYPVQVRVETRWMLYNMPPGHGILFDFGAGPGETFQWGAQGLAQYKKDYFGWE